MKTPFYMMFPIQNLYQAEMEYEQDIERMKSAYDPKTRRLLKKIEDYCDGLEFEGSRIYDEYPDNMMLRREADRLSEEMHMEYAKENEDMERLDELIFILFLDEIYRRRCRFRRQHRWW
ncbi:MAG: hypothetical protein PUB52_10860 [Lachnospiraceae bacterium]|nr:hypothetical protein [Lachnospiraceae bacterium]MDD6504779.1 hypothetical protein [Lachnospiraceae bacterium]